MSWWHLSRQYLSWQHLSISGISAVTDPILTKLFGPNFFQALILIFWIKFFLKKVWTKNYFSVTKIFWSRILGHKFGREKISSSKLFYNLNFFGSISFWTKIFGFQFFWTEIFWDHFSKNKYWTYKAWYIPTQFLQKYNDKKN